MTLYRINLKDPDVAFPRTIDWLIEMGVLVPVEEAELQAIYVKGWNDTIARAITVLIDMGLTFDQTKEFDARIRPGGAGIGETP